MTHEELLTKIDSVFYEDEGGMQLDLTGFNNQYRALRAVVELHKPKKLDDGEPKCMACETTDWYRVYPCPTIQAIEKELK